jgi:hypothetical protein
MMIGRAAPFSSAAASATSAWSGACRRMRWTRFSNIAAG